MVEKFLYRVQDKILQEIVKTVTGSNCYEDVVLDTIRKVCFIMEVG